jgi:hypothetical protein
MHGACFKLKKNRHSKMVSSLIQWRVVWSGTRCRLCEVFFQLSQIATATEKKIFLGTLNINVPANYAGRIFIRSKSQVQ